MYCRVEHLINIIWAIPAKYVTFRLSVIFAPTGAPLLGSCAPSVETNRNTNVISVKVMDSGTLCIPGQVCLLSRYSLVLTHTCCLLWDRRADLFLSCRTETETPLVVSLWKLPGFPLTYAFQVPETRLQCLNPGIYRVYNLKQSSIITLAHSDEPYIYMPNYEKIMQTNLDSTN